MRMISQSSALSLPLPLPLPLPLMQAHATVPLHSPAPLVGTPFDPRTSFEYPFPAPSAYHSPSPLWMQEGRTIPSPTPARPASAGPLSAPSYHHHPYSHLHSPLSWARPMPLPDRERATASASPTHTARAHHLPVPGQPQHPNLKLRARLMGRGVGEPPVPPGLVKRRRISEAAALEFEPVKTARSPSEGSILGAAVDGQR
ncbi:hypothetical protein FIBSPDRAFT_474604 [Athelia psychrophila]|uniref:Uncharacterized protein n=1 Tax=Athelia psychrophila TaxID=1759441 RepID=A0A166L4B8_9AGAM|nr:hypothetical protein FIBSPDRAFT_474604 [Fibularhizoctonia sp. CBS 109695]